MNERLAKAEAAISRIDNSLIEIKASVQLISRSLEDRLPTLARSIDLTESLGPIKTDIAVITTKLEHLATKAEIHKAFGRLYFLAITILIPIIFKIVYDSTKDSPKDNKPINAASSALPERGSLNAPVPPNLTEQESIPPKNKNHDLSKKSN